MSNRGLPKIGGLVWFRRETYFEAKELMEDGHRLPATFERWLEYASHSEAMHQANGRKTVRAYIDPQEFAQWCRARGLDINAKARNKFANFVAYQAYKDGLV